MKFQTAVAILTSILLTYNVNAQDDFFIKLLKNQKQYLNTTIKEKERSKYLGLLYFANVIHPKILAEIRKTQESFATSSRNIYILEGFTGYNSVSGIIWKDSIYYNYNYGADKTLKMEQLLYSQLSDTLKIIVANFSDWNHSTFAINGLALNGPTDGPFFLASKYSTEAIQTIGFYYQ